MIMRKRWMLLIIGLLIGSLLSKTSTLNTIATTNAPEKKLSEEYSAYDQLISPWNYSWSDVSFYSFELNLSLAEIESYEGIGYWSIKLRASGDHSGSPGYFFRLKDQENDRVLSTILLTTSQQNNYSYTLWSTFGSSSDQPVSSNLSLIVSWSNIFITGEGAITIDQVSLSFNSFPEMNHDYYSPFFSNSSLFFVLDTFISKAFFAITIWINSLFALDNNSNLSKTKFEIGYDLVPENVGFSCKGSISAFNEIYGEEQQSYLSEQDLSEGINCSTTWDYNFIPNNHTLFFKIILQGTGKWHFKLNSISLISTIPSKESEIMSDLLRENSPLTLFLTIVFLFAPVSIRISFFKKQPAGEVLDEEVTSEVILIEER